MTNENPTISDQVVCLANERDKVMKQFWLDHNRKGFDSWIEILREAKRYREANRLVIVDILRGHQIRDGKIF